MKRHIGEIGLEGLEFFCYHGVFPGEKRLGNRFQVDLYLTVDITAAAETDNLTHTVDYGAVYEAIAKIMYEKANLLETLCCKIGQTLLAQFPAIEQARVKVAKFNPPLDGLCEKSYIECRFSR